MKRIEFKPPAELISAVGESIKPGQRLELMGEFQVKENGDWCLTAVEGVKMPGYDKGSYPEKSEYVEQAMANMPMANMPMANTPNYGAS